MKRDEFYIGWMAKAPAGYSKHVKRVVTGLSLAVTIVAVILGTQQKQFSTSNFEFGQLTEVKGIYQHFPVPSVKVFTAPDAFGRNASITIPLVGYGKSGVGGIIEQLEKEHNTDLDKKEVVFRGSLIYSDGKTLLQIDQHEDPLRAIDAGSRYSSPVVKELGVVNLQGEILDPKCYFGVMKPGQGKPHRDCAIRCIAGGINPVFYTMNEKGEANYYLLLGTNGKKINEELKDHIAEPVALQARAVQYDDWLVLYLDSKHDIKRLGGLSWFKMKDGVYSCSPEHP